MTGVNLRYPTKAEIARVVETARGLNIVVGGLEVGPGFVRILPPTPAAANDGNAFDEWKRKRQGG